MGPIQCYHIPRVVLPWQRISIKVSKGSLDQAKDFVGLLYCRGSMNVEFVFRVHYYSKVFLRVNAF